MQITYFFTKIIIEIIIYIHNFRENKIGAYLGFGAKKSVRI